MEKNKEDETQNDIYSKLEEGKEYTTYGVAKLTGWSNTTVSIKLPRLEALGKVTKVKVDENGGVGFKYIWKKVA